MTADDIYMTVVRILEKSIYTTVLQIDKAWGWDIYTTVVWITQGNSIYTTILQIDNA